MSDRVLRLLIAPSLLLACALTVGCGQRGTPASMTETSGTETTETAAVVPGQLAFEITEGLGQYNGSGTIWVVNTDGTALQKVADGPRGYRLEHPAWSPDGQRIAYHFGVYHWGTGWLDTHSIWVMSSDGTKQTQLTYSPAGCLWPEWSPDGTKIAFSAYSAQEHEGHIAVMSADGSQVTTVTTGKTFDAFPDWTPDGKLIFLRKPYTKTKAPGDLFVVNADGTALARLTRTGSIGCFKLSPDGTTIAFHDTVASQVRLMPVDASAPPTVLIDDDFGWIFVEITWAPDGRALAVGCSSLEAASGAEIHVVNADGSNLTTVPNVEAGLDPAWRPF